MENDTADKKGISFAWRVVVWVVVLVAIYLAFRLRPDWFQSLGKMLGLHQ
jgi:hypothetical protein